MRIGIPREVKPGENRVAVTPQGAAGIRMAGATVVLQSGAGVESGFPDSDYAAAGAEIVASAARAWDADLVVKVKEPVPGEFPFLAEKTALFTYLHLAANPGLTDALLRQKVTGIAYETVSVEGLLPLLRPMSEVAGILAVQVGARGLEKACGGRGVLLSGVAGAPASRVVVIGAGNAGRSAARTAAGIGAEVVLLDNSPGRIAHAEREAAGRIRAVPSDPDAVAAEIIEADLVISTVLIAGGKAPVIVTRELVRKMRKGSVIVDISIDQGGSVETSRPTTHDAPYYVEEGVVHYCVSNMPAAVPRTSTIALTSATLPYVLDIARRGVPESLRGSPALRWGLNTFRGEVTCEGVAKALNRKYVPPDRLLF